MGNRKTSVWIGRKNHFGEIDAIANDTLLEILPDLIRKNTGTVLLRLLSRGP